MAKRLTSRQRLRRDPCNQRLHKLRAWAVRHGYAAAMLGERFQPKPHRVNDHTWATIYYRFDWLRRRKRPRPLPTSDKPTLDFNIESPFATIVLGRGWPT